MKIEWDDYIAGSIIKISAPGVEDKLYLVFAVPVKVQDTYAQAINLTTAKFCRSSFYTKEDTVIEVMRGGLKNG